MREGSGYELRRVSDTVTPADTGSGTAILPYAGCDGVESANAHSRFYNSGLYRYIPAADQDPGQRQSLAF